MSNPNPLPPPGRPAIRDKFKEFNPEAEVSLEDWRKIFVEHEDLTEYAPALQLAGSWAEWQQMKKLWPNFTKIIQTWLDEVEVRIRSNGVRTMARAASRGDVNAAKWLAEGRYKEKPQGRPTKAQIEHEKKIQARTDAAVEDEVARVLAVAN